MYVLAPGATIGYFTQRAGGLTACQILTDFAEMNSSKHYTFLLVAFCIGIMSVLTGCSAGSGRMTSKELHSLSRTGEGPIIVDVRSKAEFDRGHIPGALHIPYYAVGNRHHEISSAKEKPVVIYCAHGPRAWWAAFVLRRQGFSQVTTLEGNFRKWQESGYRYEKK